MSQNEGRPGSGRVAPAASDDTAELMAIMEANPSLGIAQARLRLDEQRGVAKLEEQENAQPLAAPTQPTVRDDIAPPNITHQHVHVEPPEPLQAAPLEVKPQEEPVQPRHPHIESSPIRDAGATRAEPVAPSFLPSDEPQPDNSAPVQPLTQPQQAEPLIPEKKEERVLDYKDKGPQIRLGTSLAASEVNEIGAEEQDLMLMALGDLVGPMQSLPEMQKTVNQFFSGLERDPRSGAPLFRSEKEENVYTRLQAALSNTPPTAPGSASASFDMAMRREDTVWNQGIQPDGQAYRGLVSVQTKGKGALAALRRKRKSGSPSTVFLPASGFCISFRSPHERDFCDFDIRMALETAKVGMNSYGLLMSASSGIYVRNIIEFCLLFVDGCSLELGGDDLKTTLIDRIDKDDYWFIIVGMLAAKFPTGIPWGLSCLNPTCDHVQEGRLNLARAIRMGSSLLTDEQRQLYYRQRSDDDNNTITYDEQVQYRQQHKSIAASVFEKDGVTVEFGRSTLGDFFDVTEEWANEINETTTRALTDYATEKDRETHLRVNAESRRLTRYLHMVKSITVDEGEGNVSKTTSRAELKTMLEELSADRVYVGEFEAAVTKFTEMSRLAVFGYMGKRCPQCQQAQGEKDGDFRGIVTISPDRVFFALSRAVSAMQRLWLSQYADIG